MSEIGADTKENDDPIEGSLTPTRSGNAGALNSPLQNKVIWDSSDPNRNPPPLPLTPQMLRINSSKPKYSSPNSVGKLQFTAVDTSEIEHQLKRISEAQTNLRGLMLGMDTSVRQTQIDLESLVDRSANNNLHLKDLIQNVNKSFEKEKDLADVDRWNRVEKALSVIKSDTSEFQATKSLILEKIDSLRNTADVRDSYAEFAAQLESSNKEILNRLTGLLKTEAKIPSETVVESLSETAQKVEGLQKLLQNIEKSVISSISDLAEQTSKLTSKSDIQEQLQNYKALEHKIETERAVNFSAFETQFKLLETKSDAQRETLEKEIQETHSKLTQNLKNVSETIETLHATSTKDLGDKIKQLVEDQKQSDPLKPLHEKLDGLYTAHEKSTTQNTALSEDLINSVKVALSAHSQELGTHLSSISELEGRESSALETVKKKDEEIAHLKSQLEDQSRKQDLNKDIIELASEKVRLETRLESLKEAYSNKYSDFKELHQNYEALQTKLNNLNLDKLKAVYGTSKVISVSKALKKDDSYNYLSSPIPNSGNRVLSTNSYLTNSPNIKQKRNKQYDLQPTDELQDQENISY